MKTEKTKKLLLENLRQMPIVELICKKVGMSRATFYRWKISDKEFARNVEEALFEGENLINDLSESQLVSLIKDRNFQAIQLWLKTHHVKYGDKLEVSGNLNVKEDPLTPKQTAIVKAALRMAGPRKRYGK